jgi:nanoRNase/pAp phosphatase (c-di-AMP/oligoRNAs hydrolase)
MTRGANGSSRANNDKLSRLMKVFVPEDKVLIVLTADPDAIASALAMKRLLWRKVAQIIIAHHNTIYRPDNLAMIRLLKIPLITFRNIKPGQFSKVVLLDSQPHHSREFDRFKINVVIDHHPPGPLGPDVMFSDIRAGYGANSTIMEEYLRLAGISPSERLATALSYGIRTDTNMFMMAEVEQDIEAYLRLYPYVNAGILRNIQSSEMRIKDMKFLRESLNRYTLKRNCLYLHLHPSPNADTLVQLADFYMKIDSVDMTVVSGVVEGRLIIIMRYLGSFRNNAGKIAETAFSGLGSAGGKATAARAELPLSGLAEVLPDTGPETVGEFIRRKIEPLRLCRPRKPLLKPRILEPILRPSARETLYLPPPPPLVPGTGGPRLLPDKKK